MLRNKQFRPQLPVWIAAFLAIFGSSIAQKPGSIHPAPDTTGFALLVQQANSRIFDQPDSAIFFATSLLEKAGNHPRAIVPIIQSKMIIARAHYVLSNYSASLEYSEEVMKLSQEYQYQPGMVYGLRNRGLIYLSQEKIAEALDELKKSETLSRKIRDSISLAAIYFNIGICYESETDMDKAKSYFTRSRDIGIRIKDWHLYLMAQNRLAESYYNTQEYEKAIKGFSEVLQFSLYSDNWEKSYAYSGLGRTYLALKQYTTAIQNGLTSLSVSSGMKAGWDMHRA
ncbi:MAG: tetratricopeptide repeat protein, partial [Sediminibacterium sp.]|nr:tetratricopeptide repeat protein [Sediminibacterium sp.]